MEGSQPLVWVYFIIFCLFVIFITGKLLFEEYKKRKEANILFVSNLSRMSSLLCMLCCPLFGFSLMVFNRLNVFCYLGEQFTFIFWYFQIVFMGLFQLSRLAYCFSQNTTHSKGYPNWLINIMYAIGGLIILNTIICPWFLIHIPRSCGCNMEYTCISIYNTTQFHPLYAIWVGIIGYIVIFWDICTLSLYIAMVMSFKKYKPQEKVYDRIMSILHRILLLTILYEIIGSMAIATHIIYIRSLNSDGTYLILAGTINGFLCISLSFCMFLMQEHNTEHYQKFLHILYKFGLSNTLCCCFKSKIKAEVEEYLKQMQTSNDNNNVCIEPTIFETADPTIKNEHSTMPDLSFIST
eukprot:547640_1